MWALLDIRQGRANRVQLAVVLLMPLFLFASMLGDVYFFWALFLPSFWLFMVFFYRRVRDIGMDIKLASCMLFVSLFSLLFPLQFGVKNTDSSLYVHFFGLLWILFLFGLLFLSILLIVMVNRPSQPDIIPLQDQNGVSS